ncbi:MAG: hypothetical protein ACC652_00090 [Acidimicrobiales bacterium]
MSAAAMLQQAVELVQTARPMPLSSSVVISRDEVLNLLLGVQRGMPDEIREARHLLKERDEFLEQAQADADAIVRDASAKAEQLVQRTEVARAAEVRARRVVSDAESASRKLKHEVEDFCDQRLAQFEVLLDRTRSAVETGRRNFQVRRPDPEPDPELEDTSGFFDQDTQ